MIVFVIIDERSSSDHPLEGAQRFIEGVRGDDPDLASYLRIEERELDVAGQP